MTKIKAAAILAINLFTLSALTTNVWAFSMSKPVTVFAPVTKSSNQRSASNMVAAKKPVVLMKVNLTQKEQSALAMRPTGVVLAEEGGKPLPSYVDLGMNGVPVLDQGMHGACVTFADIGAIDAILGKGDYISPLCLLELGSYLEKTSYMPSGWNGSSGPIQLEEMLMFGVVTKDTQQTKGCANLKEYPLKDEANEGNPMTLEDYKLISENLSGQFYWRHLLNNEQAFDVEDNKLQMQQVLLKVKESLRNGHRLTFGTILVLSDNCFAGACASYSKSFDTWAVTNDLVISLENLVGHEMIIIGYNDKAEAYDRAGNKHKGLLKLRNSWGDSVGDGGVYYMTYDFFIKFAEEVQELVPLT